MMKEGFKRRTIFLLAIMMVIALLVGCGTSVLPEESAELASSVSDATSQGLTEGMPLDEEVLFPMIFDANGGAPAFQPVMAQIGSSVTFGTLVTDPRVVIPVHPDNYQFLGWSRTADNDLAGVIPHTELWTEATAAQMVYAVWCMRIGHPYPEPMQMNFMGNGGVPENQEVTALISSHWTTFGSMNTNPVVMMPTREGVRFLGWSASEDGSTGIISDNTPWALDSPRTVWAQWEAKVGCVGIPSIAIAFDSNGGGDPEFQVILADWQENDEIFVLRSQPAALTREHHVFVGWFTARVGGVELSDIEFTYSSPRVFYARWHSHSPVFQMIFDANGGFPVLQPVVAQVGSSVTFGSLETEPRVVRPVHPDNHLFLGWSRTADDPRGVIPASELWTAETAAQVVYAVWEETYIFWDFGFLMNFRGNGGIPDEQATFAWVGGSGNRPLTITFGNLINWAVHPTVVAPVREGYRFLGWSNTEDGSTGIIAPSTHWDQFSQWIPSTSSLAWTVWAQWEANQPIQLSRNGVFEFAPQSVGGAGRSLVTTVSNTGAASTGNLSARLSGANASSFEFTHILCTIPRAHPAFRALGEASTRSFSIPNLAPGEETEFRLRAVPNLPAGRHIATVTVSGGGFSESFDIVIVVG